MRETVYLGGRSGEKGRHAKGGKRAEISWVNSENWEPKSVEMEWQRRWILALSDASGRDEVENGF
jgi:hypothetical protein